MDLVVASFRQHPTIHATHQQRSATQDSRSCHNSISRSEAHGTYPKMDSDEVPQLGWVDTDGETDTSSSIDTPDQPEELSQDEAIIQEVEARVRELEFYTTSESSSASSAQASEEVSSSAVALNLEAYENFHPFFAGDVALEVEDLTETSSEKQCFKRSVPSTAQLLQSVC